MFSSVILQFFIVSLRFELEIWFWHNIPIHCLFYRNHHKMCSVRWNLINPPIFLRLPTPPHCQIKSISQSSTGLSSRVLGIVTLFRFHLFGVLQSSVLRDSQGSTNTFLLYLDHSYLFSMARVCQKPWVLHLLAVLFLCWDKNHANLSSKF